MRIENSDYFFRALWSSVRGCAFQFVMNLIQVHLAGALVEEGGCSGGSAQRTFLCLCGILKLPRNCSNTGLFASYPFSINPTPFKLRYNA